MREKKNGVQNWRYWIFNLTADAVTRKIATGRGRGRRGEAEGGWDKRGERRSWNKHTVEHQVAKRGGWKWRTSSKLGRLNCQVLRNTRCFCPKVMLYMRMYLKTTKKEMYKKQNRNEIYLRVGAIDKLSAKNEGAFCWCTNRPK